MKQISRVNNIAGWLIFTLAAATYLYTVEPTVSLWDCGEFTASAYKLQVGHPPGAPFYLMLARVFSLFAPQTSYVALCINILSALASAFTILFLFWTITRLSAKLFKEKELADKWNKIKIIGSGAVGALAFCFSDSFWFSATEAEVYALSSLLTALVFWCALKWESDRGRYANRWLILIAYLVGISIGVHLLNLLAIPAIVMIFYFRKYNTSRKNAILALIASFTLLLVVLYILIPGTVKLASFAEIISVNSFHLPVNAGLAMFVVIMVLSFTGIAWLAHLRGKVVLNALFLGLAVIITGYSSYAMIVIRANANTPLNTGNPSHAFSLLSYLNRDQYGESPLVYGRYFNAQLVKTEAVTVNYVLENGKYVRKHSTGRYGWDKNHNTFFPRMYSANENHIEVYRDWGNIKTKKIRKEDGSYQTELSPTFLNNLQFFFTYQVGYMYLRYFMWNFAGKQNDMQGNGGIMKGNWISGFDFIDRWTIGPQNLLPDYMKKNPGRNRYFFLPLLLGIAGAIFQFSKNRRYFYIVGLLFLLTGLAIVIYTNQTPLQPRERDYVYVGSFYAFCIWIGFGTLWITNALQKKFNKRIPTLSGFVIASSIPALMFFQNLDDHNRHGRKIVRDMARNYLNSCAPNAILFTVGDNDTYPLWSLQEVEGVRTDVRVINLMLLNAHWYVDQQRRKAYLSTPVAGCLPDSFYHSHPRIQVKFGPETYNVEEALEEISKKGLLSSHSLILKYKTDTLKFSLPGDNLSRNEIFVLDALADLDGERPVYFTSPSQKGILGLKNHLRLEGFVYRLVPDFTPTVDQLYGKIDPEALYQNIMHTSVWENPKDKNWLMDDHVRHMLSIMHVRQNYARLASSLNDEGKPDKAATVLDKVMEIVPPSKVPYDRYCISIANEYIRCKSFAKATTIIDGYEKQLNQELTFFSELYPWMKRWVVMEKSQTLYNLEKLKIVKSLLADK